MKLPLKIGLVGPLPPPSGGMANQTRQLLRLLEEEGATVELVQVNPPYRPAWVGSIRVLRAFFRLIPMLRQLWMAAGRVDVFHVMANSGWAWHLCAAPAIWIAKLRRIPVVVNYRGGYAESFLERSALWVRPTMRLADRLIVPSGFLQKVFARFGLTAEIVPNVVDLGRFAPAVGGTSSSRNEPHIIVTRNLEPIYGIDTALYAFAMLKAACPEARMTVAGSGPEADRLALIARELGVQSDVTFTGRLDNDQIARLYREADVFLNPSVVDNMPNSILEALASAVPIVSTNVGGVPFVVEHERTALLVPPRNAAAIARALEDLLTNRDKAKRLANAGRESVQQYTWENVKPSLFRIYSEIVKAASDCRASGRATHNAAPTASVYTWFCSNMVFPVHERIKRHDSVVRRRALEQSQWWSRERIEREQLERLRAFLVEIMASVPYYEQVFRENAFDPAGVRSLEDLAAIPFLTKPLIRANSELLKMRGASGLARYNTGGSSGEPLVFYIGRERVSHDVAAKWRATRWWGVDIGDPEIVIWGSPIELGAQDRLRALRDRVMRTELLPAFEMSIEKLDHFISVIRARRPAMLFGYPSALSLIARHAQDRGQTMSDLGIRVAFVTSERLYPEQKAQIERVFGCPVANGYGGRDAGFIAHECPAGGMHISAEDIVVEIVDAEGRPQPAGTAGEIVVTHLATGSFPFVRYRTGDVGVLDDRACACGRGLPLIKDIQGRTTDFVVARDGTVMHGLALIYIVRDLSGIAKFKIVQESIERTRVQLVAGADFDRSHVAHIKSQMTQRLGSGVHIDVDLVDDIPAETSGKYRYVVSKVAAG